MHHLRILLTATIAAAVLLTGCTDRTPSKTKPPTSQQGKPVKQRPELVAPIEGALTALKEMDEAGVRKDIPGARAKFDAYRTHWAVIKAELDKEEPKLAQHIEQGAEEVDAEFKKAPDAFRFHELAEEHVKLGRLLANAAALLGAPIRAELVPKDATADIPFNEERRVAVTLVDHKIQPDVIELPQHTKVTFVLTNKGKEVHEFEVDRYGVDAEEIKPGQIREVTLVLLDAGEFELACYMPGHYEVGMFGKLKVTPAELKKK